MVTRLNPCRALAKIQIPMGTFRLVATFRTRWWKKGMSSRPDGNKLRTIGDARYAPPLVAVARAGLTRTPISFITELDLGLPGLDRGVIHLGPLRLWQRDMLHFCNR